MMYREFVNSEITDPLPSSVVWAREEPDEEDEDDDEDHDKDDEEEDDNSDGYSE